MRFLVISTMLVVSSVFAVGEGASKKELPMLGSLAEVLKLTNTEGSKGYPVHLRAQVTLNMPDAWWLFLQDGRSGIYAVHPNLDVMMQAGDWIEVDGVTVRGGFAPNLELHTVKVVGHGRMPAPVKPRDKRYPIPESANLWSEARGRIL